MYEEKYSAIGDAALPCLHMNGLGHWQWFVADNISQRKNLHACPRVLLYCRSWSLAIASSLRDVKHGSEVRRSFVVIYQTRSDRRSRQCAFSNSEPLNECRFHGSHIEARCEAQVFKIQFEDSG